MNGETGFPPAVGDGDHVGGLVHPALELTLVAALSRVGVGWVQRGNLAAVGAVDGVEEVVQEAFVGVVVLVDGVVGLVEDGVLGPDERVRDLEVQVGFRARAEDVGWGFGAVDSAEDGVSAVGDFPVLFFSMGVSFACWVVDVGDWLFVWG